MRQIMASALHISALTSLHLQARGKLRDNYAVGNDRIGAFDVIMGEPIPGKGPVAHAAVAELA